MSFQTAFRLTKERARSFISSGSRLPSAQQDATPRGAQSLGAGVGRAIRPMDRVGNREVLIVLAVMTAIALLLALWTTRAINPLRGDTFEYYYFDASRTVGYPAFLWLVRLITGQTALAVPAQMSLLAGSLLILGWTFHNLVGRPGLTFAFQAILLSQVAIWKSSAFLMTEALSTALVAIWCAQLLRMIRCPSLRGAALLVAVSGLATTVRPSLVALLFAAAVFMLLTLPARSRGWALFMAGSGLILAWAVTPIAQFLVHGSMETTSPFARGVLQHTLYCDPHSVPRDADSLFVEQNAARVRHYIESAPSEVRASLQRAYSTPLRFGLIIPVLGRRHHLDARSQVDPYLSRIAGERVAANPFCYAKSVAGAYYRMATFDTNRTTGDERRIRKFTAVHPPVEVPQYPVLSRDEQLARHVANEVHNEVSGLNPERQRLDFSGKVSALPLVPVRLLYGGAALLGLMSLAALIVRRRFALQDRKIFAGAVAMGVALHGTLAITSIVELGLSRYVVPLWPMVCALIAIVGLRLFASRRDASRWFEVLMRSTRDEINADERL